jgi:hypothetical protein
MHRLYVLYSNWFSFVIFIATKWMENSLFFIYTYIFAYSIYDLLVYTDTIFPDQSWLFCVVFDYIIVCLVFIRYTAFDYDYSLWWYKQKSIFQKDTTEEWKITRRRNKITNIGQHGSVGHARTMHDTVSWIYFQSITLSQLLIQSMIY